MLEKEKGVAKPGNVIIKYLGNKENFKKFKRPKMKEAITFANRTAEVSKALGHALVKTYPQTFKLMTGTLDKPTVAPEV